MGVIKRTINVFGKQIHFAEDVKTSLSKKDRTTVILTDNDGRGNSGSYEINTLAYGKKADEFINEFNKLSENGKM